METYKTTAKNFKVFARHIKKWQKKMGLTGWSIFVSHKDDDKDAEEDCAWVQSDYQTMVASITLAVTWPIAPTDKLLDLTAFHECRHLVTAPLMMLIPEPLQEIACQEEHRLIISEERLLFGKALSEYGDADNQENNPLTSKRL